MDFIFVSVDIRNQQRSMLFVNISFQKKSGYQCICKQRCECGWEFAVPTGVGALPCFLMTFNDWNGSLKKPHPHHHNRLELLLGSDSGERVLASLQLFERLNEPTIPFSSNFGVTVVTEFVLQLLLLFLLQKLPCAVIFWSLCDTLVCIFNFCVSHMWNWLSKLCL